MSITVFTPTYNRAYVLPRLYNSLLRQQTNNFEWLVIDDGSTDETAQLVRRWAQDASFTIRYYRTENGGKPRAINKAVELASTPYLFIVDSDDYLVDSLIPFFLSKLKIFSSDIALAGLGVMRGISSEQPLKKPNFDNRKFLDAPHLDRKKYGLNFDCNELYKIDILRKFPFIVWEGELFSPEEIVLYQMDLQGYLVRWYNKVGVISEYLDDGLTRNAFDLIKQNPMGYAMLFNHKLIYQVTFRQKFTSAYLMVCYVILGKQVPYLLQSNNKIITLLALPIGLIVAIRRKFQYKKVEKIGLSKTSNKKLIKN